MNSRRGYQDASSLKWIKQYEDFLWDTYDNAKLNNHRLNDNPIGGHVRYFSGLQMNQKDEAKSGKYDDVSADEIPEETIVQQNRLLESADDFVCVKCLKIHADERCDRARCAICCSRFHIPKVCPWKASPRDPIRLCKSCNGGSYYLNSRLSYLTYRRHVCNNFYDTRSGKFAEEAARTSRMQPCIKKGYEESILMLGDANSAKTMEHFDIECYNCSGTGHIMCNSQVPFKNTVKMAYCALCGHAGHSYQLCNKLYKSNQSENMHGNSGGGYRGSHRFDDYENSEDQRDSDESEDGDDYNEDCSEYSDEDYGGGDGEGEEDGYDDQMHSASNQRRGERVRRESDRGYRVEGGKKHRGGREYRGLGGKIGNDDYKEGCKGDYRGRRENDREHRGGSRRRRRNRKGYGKDFKERREYDGEEEYKRRGRDDKGPNEDCKMLVEFEEKDERRMDMDNVRDPSQSDGTKNIRSESGIKTGHLSKKTSSYGLNTVDIGFSDNEHFISTSTSSECDIAEELRAKAFQRMSGILKNKYGSPNVQIPESVKSA